MFIIYRRSTIYSNEYSGPLYNSRIYVHTRRALYVMEKMKSIKFIHKSSLGLGILCIVIKIRNRARAEMRVHLLYKTLFYSIPELLCILSSG